MLEVKEVREILFTRVKKTNREWFKATAKKLGYRTESGFMDHLIEKAKSATHDRKKTGLSKRPTKVKKSKPKVA